MMLQVCPTPGCPELTERGKCPACASKDTKASNARRGSPASRGYDAEWRRVSKAQLARHPWCRRCGQRAKHAHHIDGLGPNGPRGKDPTNLESLCLPCHSRVTAQQSPGGWNATR